MRYRQWIVMLIGLGASLFLVLVFVLPPRLQIVDAQSTPSIEIDFQPSSPIDEGTLGIIIFTLNNLTQGTGVNYSYRADITERVSGNDADACESQGLGSDETIADVDRDPDYAYSFIHENDCPVGAYTLSVSLKDSSDVEVATASADFDIRSTAPATNTPTPTATPTHTPTPTPTPTDSLADYNGWRGEYYDNADFAGNPVLVRDDADINFNWGSGTPATGLPADDFSVRWQRFITFDDDRIYRFNLKKNDGARVWYDDRLIIDLWDDDNDSRTYYTELPVTAGRHAFRVEYREDDYSAQVRFWWYDRGALPTTTPTPTPTTTATPSSTPQGDRYWRGEYFNNRDLRGTPALIRHDANINFYWPNDVNLPSPVRHSDISIQWTRNVYFEGGLYRFYMRRDDGARVWIHDRWVIDEHYNSGDATYSADVQLLPGVHFIQIDYVNYERNAVAHFWWTKLSLPTPTPTRTPTPTPTPTAYATRPLEEFSGWRAEYFSNQILAGIPAVVREDSNLNFNWGSNSPVNGLPRDHFSVRWERIVTLDGGLHRFTLEKDDGARVWVDGQLIIDHWQDCCDEGERFEAEMPLIAGDHTIRVEYYEKEGDARVYLRWNWIGPLPTPTPTPASWSATLTVGSGGGYSGYGLSTGGTLSDTNFAWRGTTYTLEAILHNPFSATVSVEFADDIGAERENLTLCLGATRFDLAQARSPNDRQFFWDNVDPGWSDGDTVSVGLYGCGG